MLRNIENKLFFVMTLACFQENIGHFDIHALTLQKSFKNFHLKRKQNRFKFLFGLIYGEKIFFDPNEFFHFHLIFRKVRA